MKKYVLQRLLRSILVIFAVSILVYFMVDFLPGDIVLYMANMSALPAETIAKARENLGLNLPVHIRYLRWIGNALRGEFGVSLWYKASVFRLIRGAYPHTIQLAFFSMLIAGLMGITVGMVAAIKQNSWLDSIGIVFATTGLAMPLFWSGLLMLWFFAVKLRWFPTIGGFGWKSLILPGLTMGVRSAALIAGLTRSSLLEVLRQEYITTARAKGLTELMVLMRHVMKNAFIPVVTILGLQMGWMLSGAVITEVVFARSGIGRQLAEGIMRSDFPLVQGLVLLIAVTHVFMNLVVDILYAYVDPRIHYE